VPLASTSNFKASSTKGFPLLKNFAKAKEFHDGELGIDTALLVVMALLAPIIITLP
jgi:hypothetical protein